MPSFINYKNQYIHLLVCPNHFNFLSSFALFFTFGDLFIFYLHPFYTFSLLFYRNPLANIIILYLIILMPSLSLVFKYFLSNGSIIHYVIIISVLFSFYSSTKIIIIIIIIISTYEQPFSIHALRESITVLHLNPLVCSWFGNSLPCWEVVTDKIFDSNQIWSAIYR